MYLCIENYSERGFRKFGTTNEFIYKPLNSIQGLFTFLPGLRSGFLNAIAKIGNT